MELECGISNNKFLKPPNRKERVAFFLKKNTFNDRISLMRFDIITIFPEIFESYLNQSLLEKADKDAVEFKIHDLRDFTSDKHRSVDDKPFGGGRGMVMKIGPIYKAVKHIKKEADFKEKER